MPAVGVDQATRTLVPDLAVVDVLGGLRTLPDLGLLLSQPLVQGLPVVSVAGDR